MISIVDGTPVEAETRLTSSEVYIYIAYKPCSDIRVPMVEIAPPLVGDFEQICSFLGHPIAVENQEADLMYGGSVSCLPDMIREIKRHFRARVSSKLIESFRLEIETESGPLAIGIAT